MAKKFWKNAYAILLALLCAAGFVFAAYFAYSERSGGSAAGLWACIAGGALSLVLVPFFHESGHIVFAKANGLNVVYWKIFVLEGDFTGKKGRISFCSPFAAEQVQAAPKRAYIDMKKRAGAYTLGGLVFGGAFLLLALIPAVALRLTGWTAAYAFFGALPYAAYLFFLNLPPFGYAGGKTDMLVFYELKTDKPCGVRLIAAMNAQGELAEGKPYSGIDRAYLENLPAIAEDEPLFAMNEFYLYFAAAEARNYETAAKHINRIAALSPYLSEQEQRAALCELTYLNAVLNDETQTEKCFSALCGDAFGGSGGGKAFAAKAGDLKADAAEEGCNAFQTSAENRAAAAYYVLRGDFARSSRYAEAAAAAAENEKFPGAAESERLLLSPVRERLAAGA